MRVKVDNNFQAHITILDYGIGPVLFQMLETQMFIKVPTPSAPIPGGEIRHLKKHKYTHTQHTHTHIYTHTLIYIHIYI